MYQTKCSRSDTYLEGQKKPKKNLTTAGNREQNRVQQSVRISEKWTQVYDVWFIGQWYQLNESKTADKYNFLLFNQWINLVTKLSQLFKTILEFCGIKNLSHRREVHHQTLGRAS